MNFETLVTQTTLQEREVSLLNPKIYLDKMKHQMALELADALVNKNFAQIEERYNIQTQEYEYTLSLRIHRGDD